MEKKLKALEDLLARTGGGPDTSIVPVDDEVFLREQGTAAAAEPASRPRAPGGRSRASKKKKKSTRR
jgi:hypothetical protein